MTVLTTVMRLLKKGETDSLNTLSTLAHALGRNHQEYGVQLECFETVGSVLLDTFPACLAEHDALARWTKYYRDAWALGYEAIASLLLQGYSEDDGISAAT